MGIYDVKHLLPLPQIVNEKTQKFQIVGHHTAGSHNPIQVIDAWNTDPDRVASHAVIGGISRAGNTEWDGKIVQAIDSELCAFHLGIKGANDPLKKPQGWYDRRSLAIEVCSYGQLTQAGSKFITYVNSEVPASQVCDLGVGNEFRGFRFYHAYSDAQIASLCRLIAYYSKLCGIALEPNRVFTVEDFTYDIAKFSQKSVAFHSNYRTLKWDLVPQPKLIAALTELHVVV